MRGFEVNTIGADSKFGALTAQIFVTIYMSVYGVMGAMVGGLLVKELAGSELLAWITIAVLGVLLIYWVGFKLGWQQNLTRAERARRKQVISKLPTWPWQVRRSKSA